MSVLPILFNPPAFRQRSGGGRATCPPSNMGSFAALAQVLVRRYGPQGTLWSERPFVPRNPVRAWQIWNEPNLPVYWCGKPNARQYVAMLRRVGRAINQVDRHAEIVTAGLPKSTLRGAVPLDRYLDQMYNAKAASAFDTLAINSYARDERSLGACFPRSARG